MSWFVGLKFLGPHQIRKKRLIRASSSAHPVLLTEFSAQIQWANEGSLDSAGLLSLVHTKVTVSVQHVSLPHHDTVGKS